MAAALGNARPRGRGRGRIERLPGGELPRQAQMPSGMPPRGVRRRPMNGGTTAPPMRGVGAQGKGKGAQRGVGLGAARIPTIPGLGRREMQRVESGKLDLAQAKKVGHERREFAQAFGADWRQKVFGSAGQRQLETRARALQAQRPNNKGLANAMERIHQRRASMLERAQAKLAQQPGKGKGRGKARGRRGTAANLLYG